MSKSTVQRRISEQFVDREHELKKFTQMLTTAESPIFMISGAGGLGKSWLVARLVNESERRGCHTSVIQCSETRTQDYESIIRAITAALGGEQFGNVNAARGLLAERPAASLAISVAASQVSVAEQARFDRTTVGVIAGAVFNDAQFVVPQSAADGFERDRRALLTVAFLEDLKVVASKQPVVLFFDAVEKMAKTSRTWLVEEILPALLDGRLSNVFVAIFGQTPMDLDPSIETAAVAMRLSPLALENVVDYLERQGVNPTVTQPLAALLMTMTGGIPYNIAMQVAAHKDAFLCVAP